MSVGGISGYSRTSLVQGMSGLDRYWNDDDGQAASTYGSSSDKSDISRTGQLMSQLMTLSATDQDSFKELAQQISEDLAGQAAKAGSTSQGSMLSSLSEKFATAAETGSMESLKPQGPPPPPPSGAQGDSTFSQVSDIISQSLSNAGISSSSSAAYAGGMDQMGALMAKLADLQATDPEAFKELAGQIAESLAGQAKNSTGAKSSKLLGRMSRDFAEAAETGSMESLQPQGPPPPPPPQSGSGEDGQSQYATPGSNQELYGLLQTLMGSSSQSLSDASSWTSFLAARSAYGVSL